MPFLAVFALEDYCYGDGEAEEGGVEEVGDASREKEPCQGKFRRQKIQRQINHCPCCSHLFGTCGKSSCEHEDPHHQQQVGVTGSPLKYL